MANQYKSALDKIRLKESEKDRAKALYREVQQERKDNMNGKKLFKPIAAMAAGLAIVVAASAVTPRLQGMKGNSEGTMASKNSFTMTVYAKELTQTGKVYADVYSGIGSGIQQDEDGEVAFSFVFPVECKGENIDTITYAIKSGVFDISSPSGESIVIDGEKAHKVLNVPRNYAGEEKEGDEGLSYEDRQYKSFTVKYDNQDNGKTGISIADTSEDWSDEKRSEYRKLGWSVLDDSVDAEKEALDVMLKDQGITCTVAYKDGTTETRDIVISNEIVKMSEITDGSEELPPDQEDGLMVVQYFQYRDSKTEQ